MKVFIINLERSKDRKEYMQKQISILFEKNPTLKEKLEFIFFKAVDAKNKEHLEFQRHFPCWASGCLVENLVMEKRLVMQVILNFGKNVLDLMKL